MLSSIFIQRPRLAFVISIVILVAGVIAYFALPVAQFPDIVPPQVQVTALYPGADAGRGRAGDRPDCRARRQRRREDALHEIDFWRRRQL